MTEKCSQADYERRLTDDWNFTKGDFTGFWSNAAQGLNDIVHLRSPSKSWTNAISDYFGMFSAPVHAAEDAGNYTREKMGLKPLAQAPPGIPEVCQTPGMKPPV